MILSLLPRRFLIFTFFPLCLFVCLFIYLDRWIDLCVRACLSPLLSSSCSRPSPGDCGCSCWGWGGEGCSPARVSLASFLPEGSPLSVPSALGGCGLCGAEPGASPSREQLGDTPRGCMGTAGEDRTAAGNGLNASLAALSCAVEGTPLLGHFWNPTGLFAGGKKESLAALRNVAVSVLSSSVFFFFWYVCVVLLFVPSCCGWED